MVLFFFPVHIPIFSVQSLVITGRSKMIQNFIVILRFRPKTTTVFTFGLCVAAFFFTFRCKILQSTDFCKIQYHVYPNFVSALLLIVPVIYMIYSTTFSSVGDVIGYLFVEGIIIFIFLLERYLCIRQFVRKFSGEDLMILFRQIDILHRNHYNICGKI